MEDDVGKRIRNLRRARGLSQNELSRLTGVAQGTISRVEHGEQIPSMNTVRRIAAALGVPIAEIVGSYVAEGPGGYPSDHPARKIIEDHEAPAGLRDLAMDRELVQVLHIKREEWEALRSLRPPAPLTKEGYVQVLLTLRAVTSTCVTKS
ncbi:MAG: XRE family transcriptional regulator [Gammaproteobacteria bacterium]|nr:MAG: XRE family transcriptional regulator [Gammaproteobacteria bacterium]